MKKILNLFLICSVLTLTSNVALAKSVRKEKVKKSDEVHIVKPEKTKTNKKM